MRAEDHAIAPPIQDEECWQCNGTGHKKDARTISEKLDDDQPYEGLCVWCKGTGIIKGPPRVWR